MKVCGLFARLMIGLLVCTGVAMAQGTTGSIMGTVGDGTGAVIPGATVTLRNVATGIERTVSTGAEGKYRAQQLGLGSYEVTAESAGFQTSVRSGITLTVGREATVDFAMQVGAVAERITVTGEAPLIETTNSTVSNLVDERQVKELPLSGRSYTDLTAIQPGVIFVTTVNSSTRTGGGRKISVNGARAQQSLYLLDGVETMNISANMAPSSVLGRQLGTDAIREFNVLTNNYGAQYGRAVGGVVNAVTSSGTNEWHGSAFEFLRNDKMDANHFFVDPGGPKTPLKQNQFGGTLGGPIVQDRAFFFLTYEGERQRRGITDYAAFMDDDARDGVITKHEDANGNPIATGMYQLDSSLILDDYRDVMHPWTRAVTDNTTERCKTGALRLGGGRCRYASSRSRKGTENYGMARIDYMLSNNHSLFGRVTADASDSYQIDIGNNPDYSHAGTGQYRFATIQLTSVLSPSMLNVASVGFTRTKMMEDFSIPDGLPPILSCIPGSTLCSGAGPSGVGISGVRSNDLSLPFRLVDNMFIYQNNVSYNVGNHSMSFGGEVKRYQMNEHQNIWYSGQMRWSGGWSKWFKGTPRSITGPLPQSTNPLVAPDVYRGYRQTYTGIFFQDDVQVLPNFTVNLGIRWARMTDPRDVNGKSGSVPDIMRDSGFTLGKVFEINSDLKGFSPRLGLAYTPFSSGRTVFRGGWGAFTEWPLSYTYTLSSYIAPYADRVQVVNPTMPYPLYGLSAGDPSFASKRDPIINAYDWHPSYTYQWNFGIEQQVSETFVAKATYVGTRSRHLYANNNPNQPVPVQDPNKRWYTPSNAVPPNPNFGGFRYISNAGDAWYHSLQTSMERRFSQGFGFKTSFTWSKNLDTAGIGQQTADTAGSINNSNTYDLRADKGLSQLHSGRSLTVSFNYEVPIGQGMAIGTDMSGVLDKILGGWQLNGVTRMRDGLPINVSSQNRCSGSKVSSSGTDRPDLAPGASNNPIDTSRPDFRAGALYFDPQAFQAPPACFKKDASGDVAAKRGYFGNLGRQTMTGPGVVSADISVFKNFAIGEGKRLQFRAEFFNIINRANFRLTGGNARPIDGGRTYATDANGVALLDAAGVPVPGGDNPKGFYNAGAGEITSLGSGQTMRQIQFALKFTF